MPPMRHENSAFHEMTKEEGYGNTFLGGDTIIGDLAAICPYKKENKNKHKPLKKSTDANKRVFLSDE